MPSLRTVAAAAATLLLAGCSGDLTLPPEGGAGNGPGGGAAPQPAVLTVVAGDDQRAKTGAMLDHPLTVQALDASARPVSGVRVEFTFVDPIAGATLDPATATTDAEGHADTQVRLGEEPGVQTIVAAVAGSPLPSLSTRFTVTATDKQGHHGEGDED